MKPRLKLTDIPEKAIAQQAKILGMDFIDAMDAIVIKGDNAFIPLGEGEPSAWVWSCEWDADDYEVDELIEERNGT